MPVKVTPEQFAEKWKRKLDGAVEDIRSGVDGVTEAPGSKAAEAADKMRRNIVEAIDSGRWGSEVGRVSLEDWKRAMTEKGIPRIRDGTAGATDEMRDFARALFGHIESGQGTLEDMPTLTLEDNVDRMTTFIRHMAEFHWRPGG